MRTAGPQDGQSQTGLAWQSEDSADGDSGLPGAQGAPDAQAAAGAPAAQAALWQQGSAWQTQLSDQLPGQLPGQQQVLPARAQGRLSARGKALAALALGLVLVAAAGTVWWLHSSGEALTGQLRTRQARTVQTQPEAAAPATRASSSGTGQAAGDSAQHVSAASAASGETARMRDTAEQPDDAGMAEEVLLPSIVEFEPGTVYSGTLGELTRLQAGSQIARADLALREVQVRLRDMERRLAEPGPGEGESMQQLEARLRASLQASLDASLQRVLESTAQQQGSAGGGWRVLAVRGRGTALEAVLVSAQGRFLVQPGQRLGSGRIDAISPTAVLLDGKPLPWLR